MQKEGVEASDREGAGQKKFTVLLELVDRIVEHISAITQSLGTSLEEHQNEQERDEKEIYAIEKQLRVLQVLYDCIEYERTQALEVFEKEDKEREKAEKEKESEVSRAPENITVNDKPQPQDAENNNLSDSNPKIKIESPTPPQTQNSVPIKKELTETSISPKPTEQDQNQNQNQNQHPPQTREKVKGSDFEEEDIPNNKRQRTNITTPERVTNEKEDIFMNTNNNNNNNNNNNVRRSSLSNIELSNVFPPASPVTPTRSPIDSPKAERFSTNYQQQQPSSSTSTVPSAPASTSTMSDPLSYNSLYQAAAVALGLSQTPKPTPQTNPFWDKTTPDESSPHIHNMPTPTAPLMQHIPPHYVYPPPMSLDQPYWAAKSPPSEFHMIPLSPYPPLMYASPGFYESPGGSLSPSIPTQSPNLSSTSTSTSSTPPTTSGIVSGLVTSKLFLSAPPGVLTDEFLCEAIHPIVPKAIKVHGKGYAFLLLASVNDSLEARSKLRSALSNNPRVSITFSPLNPEKDQRMTDQYTPISDVLFLGTAGADVPSTEIMLQAIREKVLHVHNGTGFHLVKFESCQSAAQAKQHLSSTFPSLTVRYSNKDLSLSMAVAANTKIAPKVEQQPRQEKQEQPQVLTLIEQILANTSTTPPSTTTTTVTTMTNNTNATTNASSEYSPDINGNPSANAIVTTPSTPISVTWTVSGSGTGISNSPTTPTETVKKIIKIPSRKIEDVELDPLSSPPSRGVYIGGLGNFYSADELWESLMKLYALDSSLMPSSIRLYYTKAFAFVYYETISAAEKVISKLRHPNSQYRVWQANIGFVSNPDGTPVTNKLIWVCGLDKNLPTGNLHVQMAKFGSVTCIIREGASAVVYFNLVESALQACKELQNTDMENSNQSMRLFLIRFDEVLLSCPIHSFFSTVPTNTLVILGHQLSSLSNSQLHTLLGDDKKSQKKEKSGKGILSILTFPATTAGSSTTPSGPSGSPYVMITFSSSIHASKTKDLLMGLFPTCKIYFRNPATGPLEGIGSCFLMVKNAETLVTSPSTPSTPPTSSSSSSTTTTDITLKTSFLLDTQRVFLGLGIPFQGVLSFSNPELNKGFDLVFIYCTEQQARRAKDGCVSKKVQCELVKQLENFTL